MMHIRVYLLNKRMPDSNKYIHVYNPFLVYCRELAPGTVSLTRCQAQGDDSKHNSHYTVMILFDFIYLTQLNNFMVSAQNS